MHKIFTDDDTFEVKPLITKKSARHGSTCPDPDISTWTYCPDMLSPDRSAIQVLGLVNWIVKFIWWQHPFIGRTARFVVYFLQMRYIFSIKAQNTTALVQYSAALRVQITGCTNEHANRGRSGKSNQHLQTLAVWPI